MGEETEKLLSPVEPAPVVTDVAPAVESETSPPPVPAEEKSPAEKIIEEAASTAEEQEEKLADAVEKAEEKTVVENRELIPPIDEEPAAAPFVEESYYVKDLKESEKRALQDLKSKIADAIKNNSFLAPPPKAATTVASTEGDLGKAEEEENKEVSAEVEDAAKEEEKEVKAEGDLFGEVPAIIETPVVAGAEEVAVTTTPLVPEVAPLAVEEVSASPAEEEKMIVPSTLEVEPLPSHDRDIPIEAEDETPSLEDLCLWGVPLLHTKGDERTDVVLLKFLRARDFKVNDAMSMLKDTVFWRKEFEADNLIEEEIATEFDSVAYMHGVDKEGHPVCYNHYGVFQDKELYQKTFADEAQFKKFLRWRIQVLENGMQKLDFSPSGVHSMVQVIDLKDSPGFVKRRNITKKAFSLLQDNYPELVAKQIFVNVPWYFGALYSLHGKFVTARSKSKVVVARPEKVTETLLKYISPESLPVRYGGFGRSNDTDFEGVEAPVLEVILKAGEKQAIELPEQEVGSTMVWDVVVVGWEVTYGEEFVPSGEGKYTVIIQKQKKVTAAEEPLRNSFKATTHPGKVVITIDNSSRRKKLVEYRHTIKKDAS
ncbi:hypothetical protein GOP47_0008182 [Adiantum capillus-veneris]|uniref:CRAL-TRIO domain-containing protein n=1 Tax=Adiantum capillus-veneris TaxID=13818 RepID=A0A9D4ZJF6_ADICA|nr:hypothetical protein GOP47_0008182 [Adiantum capillus-veneris]